MNDKVVFKAPGGPDVIELVQEPEPEPAAGEVKIRITAAGAAYGDVLPRLGVAVPAPTFPFTPGYDVVGTVVARGAGAERFAVGDRVAAFAGNGGYQTFLCLPEAELVPVPTGVADEKAVAVVLNYVTAYQLLVRVAGLTAGRSAFIYGVAGGVGSAMTQLARQLGITLYGTASAGRIVAARDAGAVTFDRADPSWPHEARVRAPDGMDAVFDPLGGESLGRSHALLGPGGTLVMLGAAGAAQAGGNVKLALARTMARLLWLKLRPGSRRVRLYVVTAYKKKHPDLFRQDLAMLLGWLAEGKIDPVIAEVAPLRDARRVHQQLEAASVAGKIVLTP